MKNSKMTKQPCVYLLASKRNGTLYVGVTSNLISRGYQHKNKLIEGFTKRYNVDKLVRYEIHEKMESTILREKQIKNWSRKAKLNLIEQKNPNWKDLWFELMSPPMAPGFRQAAQVPSCLPHFHHLWRSSMLE